MPLGIVAREEKSAVHSCGHAPMRTCRSGESDAIIWHQPAPAKEGPAAATHDEAVAEDPTPGVLAFAHPNKVSEDVDDCELLSCPLQW